MEAPSQQHWVGFGLSVRLLLLLSWIHVEHNHSAWVDGDSELAVKFQVVVAPARINIQHLMYLFLLSRQSSAEWRASEIVSTDGLVVEADPGHF